MALSDSSGTWLTGNVVKTDWTAGQLATSVDSLSFDSSFWAYSQSLQLMNTQRLFSIPACSYSSF